MPIRSKRSDALIKNIERTYGVDLNVRGDKQLGTLLRERGYQSQSELLRALGGRLSYHPAARTAFLSFHSEDFSKTQGLRLMFMNHRLNFDIEDVSRKSIRSENEGYVRAALKRRIERADLVMCVLGNATGSRDWIEWELETALSLSVPVCGVRIPGTFGRVPMLLKKQNAHIADWSPSSIISVVEATIARGT